MWHIDWIDDDGWHQAEYLLAEQLVWILNHASFRGYYVYVIPQRRWDSILAESQETEQSP